MVFIKLIQLSHFKSFGGTTTIPFLPGFTVVSGPNGSGKSNILDAVLFCLGLATSKGLRAERLPDLVNNNAQGQRGSAEALVSVTFDVSDCEDEELGKLPKEQENSEPPQSPQAGEWTVTRRLKVTKGGNYASQYWINGEAATVGELHEKLGRLRIYPEGYNIVLQGDVTSIISMNAKERREIIDELAGVAEFDRKIVQTKATLEEVREREEHCRIIETELLKSLERLAADALQAQKYQQLRSRIQEKYQWEKVIQVAAIAAQISQLNQQNQRQQAELDDLKQRLVLGAQQLEQKQMKLVHLNAQVKALGEEEQLAIAAQLAQYQAQQKQYQQRQKELTQQSQQHQRQLSQTQAELSNNQQEFLTLSQEIAHLENQLLPQLRAQLQQYQNQLEQSRHRAQSIAAASGEWVAEQSRRSRAVCQLQETLTPYQQEQAQLQERHSQLQKLLEAGQQNLQLTTENRARVKDEINRLTKECENLTQQVQTLGERLSQNEQEKSVLQTTYNRLSQEQRDKQRQLDKLEATQQAQRTAEGTWAAQTILKSDLPGICGLVAQLGQVEPPFQLALEIAAGGRLGFIVVEDDSVAGAAIALLKQTKAGRATFLPLNKIKSPRSTEGPNLRHSQGYVDLALNLVRFEPRYREVFAFVLGGTVVFETLDLARPHLGRQRLVTLAGDLLETTGAMTGGSRPPRAGLSFGSLVPEDSQEMKELQGRLADIERVQARHQEYLIEREVLGQELTQSLHQARQNLRERQLQLQQLHQEQERLKAVQTKLTQQSQQQQGELNQLWQRLTQLESAIPPLERSLQQEQAQLHALTENKTHQEWQEIQALVQIQEEEARQCFQALQTQESQAREWHSQHHRLTEKIATAQNHLEEHQQQIENLAQQEAEILVQIHNGQTQIDSTQRELAQLGDRLGATKQKRDALEAELREGQNQHQQQQWQQEKLTDSRQQGQIKLAYLHQQKQELEPELPNPLPKVPLLENLDPLKADYGVILENLQKEIRNGEKRLQALEPVNMRAIEEQSQTQTRLTELQEKLNTIAAERTELLLRVENFTTLRLRSFRSAFQAVNENFQTIFAELSEGDGYLQLDNPEDPFSGGLNLVAHPKGKPIQRLSSMSGGEKSLTALSFIFALQRYRPSPFYGFDEVDMFLDGANVEKLAKMVRQQAQQAQFIVVSLRRPMIEAAERTIGVTQARGSHTQVLGLKL